MKYTEGAFRSWGCEVVEEDFASEFGTAIIDRM